MASERIPPEPPRQVDRRLIGYLEGVRRAPIRWARLIQRWADDLLVVAGFGLIVGAVWAYAWQAAAVLVGVALVALGSRRG